MVSYNAHGIKKHPFFSMKFSRNLFYKIEDQFRKVAEISRSLDLFSFTIEKHLK